jgi:hypothetical protein
MGGGACCADQDRMVTRKNNRTRVSLSVRLPER